MAHDNNSNNSSNNEIQSYIYQQIAEFEPFITPETLVMVIARDPNQTEDETTAPEPYTTTNEDSIHRIAIILKEDDATIEAEARHTDIFEAIKYAKESLLQKLIEIKEEVENPQERLQAIQQASSNEQIH
jgi:ribosome-associated translation inhibitor RaiA